MAPRTAFSILVVLALAAAVTVMVSTSLYGPGMTTVAGDYLFAARSLTQGNGFVQQDGSLYLDYPPLFPIVLAPAVALGVDPAVAARWFNAVCLALIVFLPSLWLLRHLRWRALAIFGGCIFLVSLPLLDVAVMAFPEPLLVLLVLLTLWALWRYAECGRRGWYLTAAMLAALCCLTRYLGAGVILAGAVVVLVSGGQRAGRRLINAIGFGFLALLPTALWFFRNAIVSSSAWGDRAAASVTLAHNIFLAFNMMTSWFMPERVPTPLRIGVLALACGLLGVWVVRRGLRHAWRNQVLVLSTYVVAYLGVLLAVTSLVALDRMGSRFLAPLYVPSIVLLLIAMDDTLYARRTTNTAVVVVVLIWCFVFGRYAVRNVLAMHVDGAGGYSSQSWETSETIAHLRVAPLSPPVYSNDAYAVNILTGMSTRPSPRRYMFNSRQTPTDDLGRFTTAMDTTASAHLVWFDGVKRDYLYPIGDLQKHVLLVVESRFADGTIYEVKPCSQPALHGQVTGERQ